MQILLTHSYFYPFDAKQWRAQQPYPPYGTLYAAAALRAEGHEVALFDTALLDTVEPLHEALATHRPKLLVIYDDGFNYLTKMCLTRMREAAFDMARIARDGGCLVLVCSSDSTDHAAEYLSAGAHGIMLGEGEVTLCEIARIAAANWPEWEQANEAQRTQLAAEWLAPVLGVSYFNVQKDPAAPGQSVLQLTKNAARPILKDLDSLPDPAWDLVDMNAYKTRWMVAHGRWQLNIATTRGCPYKCNWCAKPIYGNRYNARSPERVAAEIAHLVRTYGVTDFWMADDIFGLKPGWVQAFRDELARLEVQITYKIQSRADLLLEADNIDALVASGLRQVWIGAESGSQKILDAMDKGTTLAQIETATRILKEKGVEICFFLQFGYLGESRDDIERTLRMMENLLPHDIGVSVSYPLPGTKFYDRVKSMLGDKQNWTDSDDLAMMYPATFQPAFYKRLHRVTHQRFRMQQGRVALSNLLRGRGMALRPIIRMGYYAPALLIDNWRLKRLEKQ
jgi:anaerobic magnesium-protoporphyrin IX monomethyl ester cyclase